jgi:hypothetical protein
MASSILVMTEDRLEGATNFNVWKLWITNILQEHDLKKYVTIVVEEPTNNARRAAFRKSQANSKQIIFDSVKDIIMHVMTSLMTTKDCMDTLVNPYEKHAPSVSGREIQTTFERLWHDFLLKESHTTSKNDPTKEEHSALASRFKGKKKGTFQKGSQRKPKTKGTFKGNNIDTSNIK